MRLSRRDPRVNTPRARQNLLSSSAYTAYRLWDCTTVLGPNQASCISWNQALGLLRVAPIAKGKLVKLSAVVYLRDGQQLLTVHNLCDGLLCQTPQDPVTIYILAAQSDANPQSESPASTRTACHGKSQRVMSFSPLHCALFDRSLFSSMPRFLPGSQGHVRLQQMRDRILPSKGTCHPLLAK